MINLAPSSAKNAEKDHHSEMHHTDSQSKRSLCCFALPCTSTVCGFAPCSHFDCESVSDLEGKNVGTFKQYVSVGGQRKLGYGAAVKRP